MKKVMSVVAIAFSFYTPYVLAEHCPLDTDFEEIPATSGESFPWYAFGFILPYKVDPLDTTWDLKSNMKNAWDVSATRGYTYSDLGKYHVAGPSKSPAQSALIVTISNLNSIKCTYKTTNDKDNPQGDIIVTPNRQHAVTIVVDTHSVQFAQRFRLITSTSTKSIYECDTTAPNAQACEW